MAVPKKRKKLAETSDVLKRQAGKVSPRQKKKSPARSVAKKTSSKIDHAFEIIDHMDRDQPAPESESNTSSGHPSRSGRTVSPLERFGFRFHISLDAVMPDNKKEDTSKSSLLDIGLTIPFFWKMPIIGGIAQKIVKNIKTVKF